MKFAAVLAILAATSVHAADDTPKVNVGATVFTDFTYVKSSAFSSFNVSRAYLNVTGNLNHLVSFRVTPDLFRDAGGSQIFRLKYAFGQLALDDWTTKGSWLRLGVQQTPYVDYTEGIYRYRFQGTVFPERIGLLSSADAGFSGHWNFPGNYGDVHAGFYNGESYNKPEVNNDKAFQIRGTLRPIPSAGLRLTAFVDSDRAAPNIKRDRTIEQVSFEHRYLNAAVEVIQAKGTATTRGWSAWATPRFGASGWEMLLRRDSYNKQTRTIAGVAYWPHLARVTSALMLDYDSQKRAATNYGVHMLINF